MTGLINKLNNNEDITINFVGDSITYGIDHCLPEETYVAKFAMLCAEKFKNHSVRRFDGIVSGQFDPIKNFEGPILVSYKENTPEFDIIRNGVGGNTVLRAYNRINDFTGDLANGKRPDVTFMMFGINDAIKNNPDKYVTAEEFKCNYKMLIDEVKKRNPETFIIIMSATTNDQSIEEHCKKTVELAKEENIPLIDLHKLWLDHFNAESEHFGHGDWLANDLDACHPTPKAAYIMAKKIFEDFLLIIDK